MVHNSKPLKIGPIRYNLHCSNIKEVGSKGSKQYGTFSPRSQTRKTKNHPGFSIFSRMWPEAPLPYRFDHASKCSFWCYVQYVWYLWIYTVLYSVPELSKLDKFSQKRKFAILHEDRVHSLYYIYILYCRHLGINRQCSHSYFVNCP
jgi:hypothetical protein